MIGPDPGQCYPNEALKQIVFIKDILRYGYQIIALNRSQCRVSNRRSLLRLEITEEVYIVFSRGRGIGRGVGCFARYCRKLG